MQMLTCIHVLFDATTTTKYAILDLLLLNADTDVSTNRYLILNQKTSKRRKPVLDSKPKNIEMRMKLEHRYLLQNKNNWQPIRIRYFNFCQDLRVHRKSQMFFPLAFIACSRLFHNLDSHPVRMTFYS